MKLLLNMVFRLINLLAEPIFLSTLLLAVTLILLWKQQKKAAGILIAVTLFYGILTGSGFLGKLTAHYLQADYIREHGTTDSLPAAKWIVILGGGITTFDHTERTNILAFSRILAGFQLYHKTNLTGQPCKIIVSGLANTKSTTSEAALYSEELVKMGVPASDIILEDKSRNTYENAMFSSRILKTTSNVSQVYVVTSGYHIKRAISMFRSLGITCIPYPSDIINTTISLPSDYNSAMTSLTLHEIAGLWQFWLYDRWGLNK